jgi:hypothetical protein
MTLPDYHFTLGAWEGGYETVTDLVSLSGLGNPPPTNSTVDELDGGVFLARSRRSPRTFTFTWEIHGTPGSDLKANLDAFAAAWVTGVSSLATLAWHFEGDTLDHHVLGISNGWDFTFDQPAAEGVIRVASSFYVPSGQILDSTNAVVNL